MEGFLKRLKSNDKLDHATFLQVLINTIEQQRNNFENCSLSFVVNLCKFRCETFDYLNEYKIFLS